MWWFYIFFSACVIIHMPHAKQSFQTNIVLLIYWLNHWEFDLGLQIGFKYQFNTRYTVFFSFLYILLFFCTSCCFFAHLIVFCTSYCFLHILLFCTFFISLHILLLFLLFLTICMPLCYVTLYNLYSYYFALSTERTWFDYISLLIIPCITIMWQIKKPWTLNLKCNSELSKFHATLKSRFHRYRWMKTVCKVMQCWKT